ncbi:MAG: META domain-containing protein [Paracoccaceae bacterium]
MHPPVPAHTGPMLRLFLILPILLAACLNDETISGYTDPDAVYHLEELGGSVFTARATISFPEQGRIAGKGPCNSYSASQNAPYPWLELGLIAATRAACSDLATERAFFQTLGQMTLIEVLGDIVILRNDARREMIFRSR